MAREYEHKLGTHDQLMEVVKCADTIEGAQAMMIVTPLIAIAERLEALVEILDERLPENCWCDWLERSRRL